MGKIFDIDFRRGSLIDSVGGIIGTHDNTQIKKHEKGLSLFVNEDLTTPELYLSDQINCGTEHSLVFWFKLNRQTSHSMLIGEKGDSNNYFSVRDTGTVLYRVGATSATHIASFDNNWHFIIFTRSLADTNLYIDGEFYSQVDLLTQTTTDFVFDTIGNWDNGTLPFDGYIGKVAVYDHILIATERAKLHQEFLRSTPITKAVV